MQAYELHKFSFEHFVLSEKKVSRPQFREVLIRLKACSLNFRDLLIIKGEYNPNLPLPFIPLSDGVGEVVELGPGVTRFQIGDRVIPIFSQSWLGGSPSADRCLNALGGPLDGTL